MGVLPLQFKPGTTRRTLALDGTEVYDITGIAEGLAPRCELSCNVRRADGVTESVPLDCRIDTLDELDYYRHGGILRYVVRNMLEAA